MEQTKIKNLKVLHVSTANKTRGIADYTKSMMNALSVHGAENQIHMLDEKHLAYLSLKELKKNIALVCEKVNAVDVVHIQHEFSFFSKQSLKSANDIFYAFLQQFSEVNKPIVVTFHTEADFFSAKLRSFLQCRNFFVHVQNYQLNYQWNKKISQLLNKNPYFHVISHTKQTKSKLIHAGIFADKITVIPVGISLRDHSNFLNNAEAKQVLNYSEDTVLLSLFGFITENKGHEFAIKALQFLPKHYQLAIVGGPHPEAKHSNIERVLELSRFNDLLKERIRITGYVDQKTADLYHAATDICLAPYHGNMSGSAAIGWALSSGKPTIASNTTTFAEINSETQCLLLCEEKSTFDLAKQIKYLVNHPDLQAILVKNA